MDNGHQVLVGPWFPRSALALRFSADGTLTKVDDIPLPSVTDRESLEQAVLESFFRIGAVPDTILMRRFSSENPSSPLASVPGMAESVIQIIDLPIGLEDPEGYAELDRDPDEYTSDRERWLASGNYVLAWGADYYVDGQGRVIST
jgi:hypothetical protein